MIIELDIGTLKITDDTVHALGEYFGVRQTPAAVLERIRAAVEEIIHEAGDEAETAVYAAWVAS